MNLIRQFLRDVFFASIILLSLAILSMPFCSGSIFAYAESEMVTGVFASVISLILYFISIIVELIKNKKANK